MNWAAGELVGRWNRGPCYTELDRAIQRRGLREAACPPHVGDLLEPGEWDSETTPRNYSRGRPSPNPIMQMAMRYAKSFPDAFKGCGLVRLFGPRMGRCLLPSGHASWPGGALDSYGLGHRIYLFSPRDSAAMLAGMRARLTEPMGAL